MSILRVPHFAPELYETLVVDRVRSPGIVESVTGHDSPDKWDVQEPKGSTGAITRHNGRLIRRPKVTIFLGGGYDDEPDDFAAWPKFQRVLDALTEGPTPKAVRVFHPDLALNRITEITRANVSGIMRDSRGGARVVVELIEYAPPQPKRSRAPQGEVVIGDIQTGPISGPRDPNADKRAELAALQRRASQA